MADTRKPRRVGPLPWQAKLRMARNDRQWDAVAAQQDAITAQINRSVTCRFLEDEEARVVAESPIAGAERIGSAIERAQARAALAPFERFDAPVAAKPITAAHAEAMREYFTRAVSVRPGTTPGPWIEHPGCAPTLPCSTGVWSRIRCALAAIAARVRRSLLARPE